MHHLLTVLPFYLVPLQKPTKFIGFKTDAEAYLTNIKNDILSFLQKKKDTVHFNLELGDRISALYARKPDFGDKFGMVEKVYRKEEDDQLFHFHEFDRENGIVSIAQGFECLTDAHGLVKLSRCKNSTDQKFLINFTQAPPGYLTPVGRYDVGMNLPQKFDESVRMSDITDASILRVPINREAPIILKGDNQVALNASDYKSLHSGKMSYEYKENTFIFTLESVNKNVFNIKLKDMGGKLLCATHHGINLEITMEECTANRFDQQFEFSTEKELEIHNVDRLERFSLLSASIKKPIFFPSISHQNVSVSFSKDHNTNNFHKFNLQSKNKNNTISGPIITEVYYNPTIREIKIADSTNLVLENNKGKAISFTRHGLNNQQFLMEKIDNFYKIKQITANVCLSVMDKDDGSVLRFLKCDQFDKNQLFIKKSRSKALRTKIQRFYIYSYDRKKALSVYYINTAPISLVEKTRASLFEYNPNQKTIKTFFNQNYRMMIDKNTQALILAQIEESQNVNESQFEIEEIEDLYKIKNGKNCLGFDEIGRLKFHTCSDEEPKQKWRFLFTNNLQFDL
ncbi:hypothetical protein NUSPORA_00981 [Nucleospora cyclopteri]